MSMEHQPTDTTLLAAPFGFGPLGKAMAIAHEFENRGLTVKVLGDESAQKIATASGLLAGDYEYRAPLDLRDLNTGVALSCLDISTPITKSGIPLLLVDSLFWLRGLWERFPEHNADRILAQRFFVDAPQEVRQAVGDRLYMVDAILPASSIDPAINNDGDLVVLYPGGMRSPYLDLEYQGKYLSWGIEVVSEAMRTANVDPSNLVAITPPQLLGSLAARAVENLGGHLESSVTDLGHLLRDARCLVLAPGIEITLEACAMGKAPHYIPAFNGSHIPQLMAYRRAGVGKEICPSYADALRELETKTGHLSGLSKEVEQRNFDLLLQPEYKQEGVVNLVGALTVRETLADRYPLGKYGATQVVDHALSML
jgi:hypothetical protein